MPCASTASISAAASPALASAWRIIRSCEGPLGAVIPFEAPSWLVAEPRIVASTRWPLRRASERRSIRTTPTPSERPVPSAAAAKALQRPSGESARRRLKSISIPGVVKAVTPPAMTSEHSPERSACAARCIATSEEEQAVSTETAGPSSPSV